MKFKVGQRVMGTTKLYEEIDSPERGRYFAAAQIPRGDIGTVIHIFDQKEWRYKVRFELDGKVTNNNYGEEHLMLAIADQLDLI